MDYLRIALLVLLCFIGIPAAAFLQQYIGVRGRLVCGKLPLQDTKVTLWDKNVIGSDLQLSQTKTDKMGSFEVEGGTSALFTMDVHLKIDHNCNEKREEQGSYDLDSLFSFQKCDAKGNETLILMKTPQCFRRVDLPLPSHYIYRGSGVQRWFDAGTINMSFPYPSEKRKCIG